MNRHAIVIGLALITPIDETERGMSHGHAAIDEPINQLINQLMNIAPFHLLRLG